MTLIALPHPDHFPHPGTGWPGPVDGDAGLVDDLARIADDAFRSNPNERLALSLGLAVAVDGRLLGEWYGPDTTPDTPLLSWSVAKSVTHAALGRATSLGVFDVDAPPTVPYWSDERRHITTVDLLRMRSGLEFNEDYVDADTSHCIEMLFGSGANDVAGYAARQPSLHPRDEVFNYSSGTTNILVSLLIDRLAPGGTPAERRDAIDGFLRRELFVPIGVDNIDARCDAAGTWVGSSYLYLTLRDWLRFGALYLRGGAWAGRQLLPAEWVDRARTTRSTEPDTGAGYGEHWWTTDDRYGTFYANGYEGQRVAIVPGLNAVIARFGKTPIECRPALVDFHRRLIDAIAAHRLAD